jgi:diguanylate cyclase (GGDEF)-like protein
VGHAIAYTLAAQGLCGELRLTDFDDDYLGHTAGDWFIRVLADRLREGAEGPNLIARLGGDEFVVVPAVPMDADTAEALACRLQSIPCEGHRRRNAD